MIDTESPVTAAEIQTALARWLRRWFRGIVMGNVFVVGSPWESDVIAVTQACYWHEYEIKTTVADFRKDFAKCEYGQTRRVTRGGRLKHDVYASSDEIQRRWGRQIPKPKTFSFVVPEGMLDAVEVPAHCGVLEYKRSQGKRGWLIHDKSPAPTLKKPTKLDKSQIFNLAWKLSARVNWAANYELAEDQKQNRR